MTNFAMILETKYWIIIRFAPFLDAYELARNLVSILSRDTIRFSQGFKYNYLLPD